MILPRAFALTRLAANLLELGLSIVIVVNFLTQFRLSNNQLP